jgi:4-amino-4-deoxy-L-arabinose transferase-like glycosyltransferase
MLPSSDRLSPRLLWGLLWAWGILTLATLGLAPLFDYDETIYAQTALDMMHHGQWIVPTANGVQFFEKPPFTYYMMDLCFSIFGNNAFAARLPSALFSFGTALLLLHFGTRLHSRRLGLLAAAIFLSMLEVGFLAHAAILDAVLNFFIAATLLNYALWLKGGERRHALWCAAMMGAAVSIKGPVGAVVPLIVIAAERLLSGNFPRLLKDTPWLAALPVFLITATPWYLMILAANGPAFLYDFIWIHNVERALHPMQGHGGHWYYYLVVFAVSVLPWLASLPWAFGQAWRLRNTPDMLALLARLGALWTLLVILLFSLAQTKLPHYISCIYPGVAMLIAAAWMQSSPSSARAVRIVRIALLLLVPLAILLLAFPQLYPWLQHFTHHPRALAILQQPISPAAGIPVFGLLLLVTLVWLTMRHNASRPLFSLIVAGMVLQFTLLTGLGTFAGRLMQAPTIAMADTLRRLPADLPFYSYNLNAPSVSFYAGRNYIQMLDAQGATQLATAARPFALMLRSESRGELPFLNGERPLVEQGGYLLFVLREGKTAP